MTYVALQESVERILRAYSVGETFSTHDVYDQCKHRQATMLSIAHYISKSPLVENTTTVRGKIRRWRRI